MDNGLSSRQRYWLLLAGLAIAFCYVVVVPLVAQRDAASRADLQEVRSISLENQKLLQGIVARSDTRTQTFSEIQTSLQVILRRLVTLGGTP